MERTQYKKLCPHRPPIPAIRCMASRWRTFSTSLSSGMAGGKWPGAYRFAVSCSTPRSGPASPFCAKTPGRAKRSKAGLSANCEAVPGSRDIQGNDGLCGPEGLWTPVNEIEQPTHNQSRHDDEHDGKKRRVLLISRRPVSAMMFAAFCHFD